MSGQLKEVRDRMKSVKSTQQITKAMKMVSAAKLRKAQQAITEMRPYADRLNKILGNILSNVEGDASTSYGLEREVKKAALVIVTSNKGLCGAFNTNVIKQAITTIDGEFADVKAAGNLTVIALGKKGSEAIKRRYPDVKVVNDFMGIHSNLTFEALAEASGVAMEGYKSGEFDKVVVCYSQFRNAAVQEAQAVQYLPVEKLEGDANPMTGEKADYIFEPSKEKLLEDLVPSILQTTFQKFVLDTHAGEHGARMSAMDSATENAEEMLKTLKISYNKARQEAITKELSEIVGGAAALGG